MSTSSNLYTTSSNSISAAHSTRSNATTTFTASSSSQISISTPSPLPPTPKTVIVAAVVPSGCLLLIVVILLIYRPRCLHRFHYVPFSRPNDGPPLSYHDDDPNYDATREKIISFTAPTDPYKHDGDRHRGVSELGSEKEERQDLDQNVLAGAGKWWSNNGNRQQERSHDEIEIDGAPVTPRSPPTDASSTIAVSSSETPSERISGLDARGSGGNAYGLYEVLETAANETESDTRPRYVPYRRGDKKTEISDSAGVEKVPAAPQEDEATSREPLTAHEE
ncbi:MAG: hypothetical protein Q9227_008811 [Pyrenula ochraceoflavens]